MFFTKIANLTSISRLKPFCEVMMFTPYEVDSNFDHILDDLSTGSYSAC